MFYRSVFIFGFLLAFFCLLSDPSGLYIATTEKKWLRFQSVGCLSGDSNRGK